MRSVASISIKRTFLKRNSYFAKAKPANELNRMEKAEPSTATMAVFNSQRTKGKSANRDCIFWIVGLLGKKVIGEPKISALGLKALSIMYRNGTMVSTTSKIKTALIRTVPTTNRARLEGAALEVRATGLTASCTAIFA